jgi:hypothetical protein
MRRVIVILAVMAIVTGCAMWTKAPVDDPATPNNEAEDHAALVEEEEAKIKVGVDVATALAPPPFDWMISLASQAFFSIAAMRRGKK